MGQHERRGVPCRARAHPGADGEAAGAQGGGGAMIRFVVPGRPHGKRRPRVTMRGRTAIVYTPRETREYEQRVAWEAKAAGARVLDGPVGVRIVCVTPRRNRPDLDNAAKSVLDGLNGICWNDDRQVIELHVLSRRGRPERVEVEVWEADAEEGDVA